MKETFDAQKILSREELRALMERTNKEATIRIVTQLALFAGLIVVLATFELPWYGLAACVFGLGWMIWSLYAPLHECSHGTAFRNQNANFVVSWITGIIFGYSPGLHVAFHFKHHRLTNKDNDPERGFDLPAMPFRMFFFVVIGAFLGLLIPVHTFLLSFLPVKYWDKLQAEWTDPKERKRLQRGAWIVTACWAGAFYLMALHPWLWLYMIVGLVIGRLINAFITVAEHQGRDRKGHMLHRSRSVKSNAIVSWFWWNLNYHAEHHTWPTVPFHRLPHLQRLLEERGATHISEGYFSFYQQGEYRPKSDAVVSETTSLTS